MTGGLLGGWGGSRHCRWKGSWPCAYCPECQGGDRGGYGVGERRVQCEYPRTVLCQPLLPTDSSCWWVLSRDLFDDSFVKINLATGWTLNPWRNYWRQNKNKLSPAAVAVMAEAGMSASETQWAELAWTQRRKGAHLYLGPCDACWGHPGAGLG